MQGHLPPELVVTDGVLDPDGPTTDVAPVGRLPIHDENGITHRVYIYLGTVESEIDPTIDHEHTDARWMHINDLPNEEFFSRFFL